MKKIIMSILCLLFLFQASAFAKVEKSLSHNVVHFQNESRYKINGTNKSLWILLSRDGYFGKSKLLINPDLYVGFYKDESPKGGNAGAKTEVRIGVKTEVKADLGFWTKTPPHFVLSNKESGTKQIFVISEISTDHAKFSINNKDLLIKADKVSIVLTLNDGSIQKIDIPDDVLKDWKFILSCNLLDEYKKGI
jgi:hypothetical protein